MTKYQDIASGAALLEWFGMLANVLGSFAVFGGVVVGVYLGSTGYAVPGMAVAAMGVGYGVVLFIAAAFMSLFAGLSVAVRDIAINTSNNKDNDGPSTQPPPGAEPFSQVVSGRFRVEGINPVGGTTSMTINAADRMEAKQKAEQRGLRVTSVSPVAREA